MDTAQPSSPETADASAYKAVGAIASLGPRAPWQTALLLPLRYEDLTLGTEDHRQVTPGEAVTMRVTVVGPASTHFAGRPRLGVTLMDPAGETFKASAFGELRTLKDALTLNSTHWMRLSFKPFDGRLWGRIDELVPAKWAGRLRPVYPGIPNHLDPAAVREKVIGWLPAALPRAAAFLEHALAPWGSMDDLLAELGAPGWRLEQLLLQAHCPKDARYSEFARHTLLQLAAAGALLKARRHHGARPAPAWTLPTLAHRLQALPFTLSPDQAKALGEIAADLARPVALRGVLVGDVGSGKSAVFSALAAAIVDAGGRAAIMLPNGPLAEQVYRDLITWWPDLEVGLVSSDAGDSTRAAQCALVVGTTALLFQAVGHRDLVVVDEEQKFSVAQKERLLGEDSHQLLVSATCIPRTMALSEFGATSAYVIERVPVTKCIHTRLWRSEARAELMHELLLDLRSRQKVLMVYPQREADSEASRRDVANAFRLWEERHPGRVRAITGDDDEATKREALQAIREDRADLILATAVAEVGIDLVGLIRVVIVEPELFGLTSLHQIRGRVARRGGDGFCELFCPNPLSEKAERRLAVLLEHQSGFSVAAADLELRGYGDLGQGVRQTGADTSFLFGQATPAAITRLVAERLSGRNVGPDA